MEYCFKMFLYLLQHLKSQKQHKFSYKASTQFSSPDANKYKPVLTPFYSSKDVDH